MTVSTLHQQIDALYPGLSPKGQEAARYIREHPAEIALHGLRSAARKAGTSPASVLRLLQTLGFGSWAEFQALHQHWLTEDRSAVFSRRAGDVVAHRRGSESGLLLRLAEAETANAASGLAEAQHPALAKAADRLATAGEIGILGLRSCHSVAYGLAYGLSLFRPGVRLIGATGGMMLDEIDALSQGAMLVAISIAPYSRETVEATRHGRSHGMGIIAVTDAPFGQLSRLSDITLTATTDLPAHLASVTGLVALCEGLTSLVLTRSGEAGLAALRLRESRLSQRSAYLPPED